MKYNSKILAFGSKFLFFCGLIIVIDQAFSVFRYPEKNIFFSAMNLKRDWIEKKFREESTTPDLAFVGSSLAQFGLDADGIGDLLNVNAENYGLGGMRYLNHNYLMIRCLHQLHNVKTIVLSVESSSINLEVKNNMPAVDAKVTNKECIGKFTNPKTDGTLKFPWNIRDLQAQSNAFKYARNLPRYAQDLMHDNRELPYKRKPIINKGTMLEFDSIDVEPKGGWIMADGQLRTSYIQHHAVKWKPSTSTLAAFDRIIEYTQAHNIELVVLEVPMYVGMRARQPERFERFEEYMCERESKGSFRFINLNRRDVFDIDNPSLFLDSNHLNSRGAEALVSKFARAFQSDKSSCDDAVPAYRTISFKGRLRLSIPNNDAVTSGASLGVSAISFIGPYGVFERMNMNKVEIQSKPFVSSNIEIFNKVNFSSNDEISQESINYTQFDLDGSTSNIDFPFIAEVPFSWLNNQGEETETQLVFSLLNESENNIYLNLEVQSDHNKVPSFAEKIYLSASQPTEFKISLDSLFLSNIKN